MKNTKGITLIALVITIIILLILAGISISMLSGENSILKRATEAKDETGLKSFKEEIQLVLVSRTMEKTTTGTNIRTLKEDLENGIRGATIEDVKPTEEYEALTDVYYISKNGKELTVYEDGDIEDGKNEIWNGSKVTCPEFKKENDICFWYIYTPSQLKFLADFINNGRSLSTELERIAIDAGYTDTSIISLVASSQVHLMNNLDMGARPKNGNTKEERWETEENEKIKWIPIGSEITNDVTSKSFPCLFNGNDHFIKGLYVNESEAEDGYSGLFGGLTISVRNLTVKNSYIKGKKSTGGIAGVGNSRFEKCNIIDSIVISTQSNSGGISGVGRGHVIKCCNYNTEVYGSDHVGGIIGQKNSGSKNVEDCVNTGTIKGEHIVGGIIGSSINNITTTIIRCINEGKVEGINNYSSIIGGIIALGDMVSITDSYNKGTVKGYVNVGGIIGVINTTGIITNCINSGIISGKVKVDGIAALYNNTCTITNCVNNGKINILND